MPRAKVDLNTVDPTGRIDVLAYRGAEQLARWAEARYGLRGIWESLKPHIHEGISNGLGNVKLSPEAKAILSIIQANYQPKIEGTK